MIFQKQGEVTASLLPQALTGYSFLFPTDRDLNKAHELRGGLTPPPLTLTVEGDGAMQLAAQRIALNLHEAGFNVQMARASQRSTPDLILRQLPLAGAAAGGRAGITAASSRVRTHPVDDASIASLFQGGARRS